MAKLKLNPDLSVEQQHDEEVKLRRRKANLMKKELRKWQKNQPYKPGDSPGYRREIFSLCSFMMPVRRRLADTRFESDNLRGPIGIQVIQDMIKLCEQERE